QPPGAYYTVRSWDPVVGEMTCDFVLHGDEGLASAWATRARPGDKVALWGPRTAYAPPADTEWYLLVGDETGQPGIGAIVDSLPADAVVHAVIEVSDDGERQ
ncbi:MAG TPA: siderophore-interacting protein, partial [Ilumatobacteraceae bacterium]|nr:siderophore-interacting protein [Ilumatobacteraceae bacterium]